ncbi:glucokinase [Gracilibacillus orientalis]|uniref:Glucokinase n=1 Tax=Gracilibacillus orientalis TaxID=334253 RepID=A0A1I4K1D6_9BACI|nr:glucokinase [Gracilibacillus orientalis]
MSYVISIDVGGTTIHAAVLSDGVIQTNTITTYDSYANKDKQVIINHLKDIVEDQIKELLKLQINKTIKIKGVGIAFPGPADYNEGVSYIKGLEKYDSLYKVNIKKALFNTISDNLFIPKYLSKNFSIHLGNDATLFAVGEFIKYKNIGIKRIACFTLGTGIGSTFICEGRVVKGEFGIPDSGFIYNAPYKKGIVEDYISKKGISNLALQHGFSSDINVRELAELAKDGHTDAEKVFNDFGVCLAEAVNPFIYSFKPEIIVFGGQISKSFKQFESSFSENMIYTDELKVKVSDTPLISTFAGANNLIN